ncbi:MAG: hypothetical protein IJL33_08675 [Ruminococcus sp.]|jgi:hypothetical protein|uniref:hypothetical protein n=1 Tax=Ruminococcus flavefaciens TaxID=1265 RepID=UPI0013DBE368|nr:hypothetical protein [Ruminococcus flavefaciens]MBQ6035560.1 hypothetical protein [Ruminococcus sp.]
MTINKNEITAKVSQISSLYQLLDSKEQLGEPCLLLIYTDSSTVLGADDSEKSAVKAFLSDAQFMSAIVSEGEPSEELRAAADMCIKAEEADEFVEKIFKDKTKKQIQEINACFIAARKAPAEKVLELESRAFYRLMADKNGGGANE